MQSAIKERELELAKLDQSYEAKCARAIAVIDRQMKHRIDALRVVGPIMPILSEQHIPLMRHRQGDFVIANCRFCNPPPKTYKCPQCDWECDQKWRMKLHNDLQPGWCKARAKRKIQKWSRQA